MGRHAGRELDKCFCGSWTAFEQAIRDGIQTWLLELGENLASAVSENTDFLIVGEKAGSKSGEYLLRKYRPRRWALLPLPSRSSRIWPANEPKESGGIDGCPAISLI